MGSSLQIFNRNYNTNNSSIILADMALDTIVFDLGGVIIPLDRQKCEASFRTLYQNNKGKDKADADFDAKYLQKWESGFFDLYERGGMSSADFTEGLDNWLGCGAQAIIDAWNSLFGNIPVKHLEILKALSSNYTLCLLSNTNAIHMDWIRAHLTELGFPDFGAVFKTQYLSYELKLRKPDVAIYKAVQQKMGLESKQFVFIEDTAENLEGAQKAGWKVLAHPFNSPLENIIARIEALSL
ncbi:MAG: FMN phosphatase YigB (HAD superfamily) [Limisphaerales bacterium]|jgi:FMN phosphatase YigB (HAD superfamily)